jgi:hypothetical protein
MLPPRSSPPENVNAVVEIPRGSRSKYEYDAQPGVFRPDRVFKPVMGERELALCPAAAGGTPHRLFIPPRDSAMIWYFMRRLTCSSIRTKPYFPRLHSMLGSPVVLA